MCGDKCDVWVILLFWAKGDTFKSILIYYKYLFEYLKTCLIIIGIQYRGTYIGFISIDTSKLSIIKHFAGMEKYDVLSGKIIFKFQVTGNPEWISQHLYILIIL